MKYLIVGLGNIGPEYHETRHNIGFMVVDTLAKAAGATFTDGRYGFTTTLSVKGRQLLLLKPSTFMNLSGNAVRYWMQKENIPLENVLVVVDDLALPFGTLRLKGKGSDAGLTVWQFNTFSTQKSKHIFVELLYINCFKTFIIFFSIFIQRSLFSVLEIIINSDRMRLHSVQIGRAHV